MLKRESNQNWMKARVCHSLPGRLRLTATGLRFLPDNGRALAEALARFGGMRRVRVNAAVESVLLEYDPERLDAHAAQEHAEMALARFAMDAMRARHGASTSEDAEAGMSPRQLARRLAVNAGALLLGNTALRGAPWSGRLGKFTSVQALISLGLSWPMAKGAARGLRRELRPNADFLTVTSIVASLLLGNSALMILALSDLAEMMTSYTIERTRSSIKKMLSVEDENAWKVLPDGRVERCPIDRLRPGDEVEAHTGEKLAIDGAIISGAAVIDQSAITGEFEPAEKAAGDEVFAGTVVKSGNLRIRVAKVGDQTVVSRIVGMVEASELKKAPIQRYADRFSNYLVPLNFLLCLTVWLVTRNPQKALKMLVIDYSCGIKLSTATAFSAAINTAVRKGVLIKGGAYIEQMSNANTVLLDKTGTITEGRPQVVSMRMYAHDMDERAALSLAMAAEETSAHPLASAILAYGRKLGAEIPAHGETVTEVSRGRSMRDIRSAFVTGATGAVGSALVRELAENGVRAEEAIKPIEGAIATYVGVDKRIIAALYAMDRPRENVRRAINSLRYDGVGDIELLTGDMEPQARAVAELVGADGYQAQLLPEQKAEAVLKLQTQGNGVVMVGDGINDAPALAYADVGVSLGSKSTDIAIETSDVVIGRDDPMMIPELRRLSRATMRIVRENFTLVVGVNSVGLILGAASGISVMMSAMLHNMSTILVVANSLRLMFFPPTERREML